MSELEILLERYGWTIVQTPFTDVAERWDSCEVGEDWIARKGPIEAVTRDAAELTSMVYAVEEKLAQQRGEIKITRDAPPPKRKRRKRVTSELLRCVFPDTRRETICGALVWDESREKLLHAQKHLASHEITEITLADMYQTPKRKNDND